MTIEAVVRVQAYKSKPGGVFVRRGEPQHGVARGRIQYYAVTGQSWAHIRRVLKLFEVDGHSNVSASTVERWFRDLGCGEGSFRVTPAQRRPAITESLHA